MLIPVQELQLIAEGRVSVAFRRWVRPTVKTAGTLRTSIGVLAIDSVEPIDERNLSAADAAAAGFSELQSLRAALNKRAEGTVYRVALRLQGADLRTALREQANLSPQELEGLTSKLRRLDARSNHGAWTERTLRAIHMQAGCRAADLAAQLRLDKDWLKVNIRKLKELGLTESLEVGYLVSPRGEALLSHLERGDA